MIHLSDNTKPMHHHAQLQPATSTAGDLILFASPTFYFPVDLSHFPGLMCYILGKITYLCSWER